MSEILVTWDNFDTVVSNGESFITNERGNNLRVLIQKWNKHTEHPNNTKKRLKIQFVEFEITDADTTFRNIDIGEVRLHTQGGMFLYLYNSNVGILKFEDLQNGLKQKVIQGDSISKIDTLSFDNIHFNPDNESYLVVYNLIIESFFFIRSINLSERIQILGCDINKLILSAADLGEMLFIENKIKNLYITGSVVCKTKFHSNRIGTIHQKIKNIPGFPVSHFRLSDKHMADISRQLKTAFDESKSYREGDRFYADEMLYELKSKYFLSPLLILHLISSNFGTSWLIAILFIASLGFIKLCFTTGLSGLSAYGIINGIINNINPYTNYKEVSINMTPEHFLYLVLLSYGLYQFVLSVRRIAKR